MTEKLLGNTRVWPSYDWEIGISMTRREKYVRYTTWIPVDDGYHVLFKRDYYVSDFSDQQGQDPAKVGFVIFHQLLTHINYIQENYDPANYEVVNKKVLKLRGIDVGGNCF